MRIKSFFIVFIFCVWPFKMWISITLFYFQDQYQFCYRAALEYLGSFDHYANWTVICQGTDTAPPQLPATHRVVGPLTGNIYTYIYKKQSYLRRELSRHWCSRGSGTSSQISVNLLFAQSTIFVMVGPSRKSSGLLQFPPMKCDAMYRPCKVPFIYYFKHCVSEIVKKYLCELNCNPLSITT